MTRVSKLIERWRLVNEVAKLIIPQDTDTLDREGIQRALHQLNGKEFELTPEEIRGSDLDDYFRTMPNTQRAFRDSDSVENLESEIISRLTGSSLGQISGWLIFEEGGEQDFFNKLEREYKSIYAEYDREIDKFIKDTQAKINIALEKADLDYSTDYAKSTNSVYINFDDKNGDTKIIRISDHPGKSDRNPDWSIYPKHLQRLSRNKLFQLNLDYMHDSDSVEEVISHIRGD